MPNVCKKILNFFGVSMSPAYSPYSLRISDPELKKKFYSRKRLQVYQNCKIVFIVQLLMSCSLIYEMVQNGYWIRCCQFLCFLFLIVPFIIYRWHTAVMDYAPTIYFVTKTAMTFYFQYMMVEEPESKKNVIKYLFWMQYYNLIYLDYLTVRFLVNAIVASTWDLAGNCIILKYVLLPILFDFKESPGVLYLMLITIFPLLVLRIGV